MSLLKVQRRRALTTTRPRQPEQNLSLLEDRLTRQLKMGILIEADRKEFSRQAEQVKGKNQDWIDKLRQENKKLKDLRDQLISSKRADTAMSGSGRTMSNNYFSSISNPDEIRNQGSYRRELDRQKYETKRLKQLLTALQDKLDEVDTGKLGVIDQNPLMRDIRILENRLDKIMIKYNEANALRETYEQVVKRLKEERIGYDNQLTAIERSLKGKEHDFEELLLLAHDANHAKQQAQAQLRKYQHKRTAIKDLRENYLSEKREAVEHLKPGPYQHANQNNTHNSIRQDSQGSPEQQKQEDDFSRYETAFVRMKQVTGVTDTNEIIQKFKNQNATKKSLYELKERYKTRIEELKHEKIELRSRLNSLKYEQPTASSSATISSFGFAQPDRRKIQEIEQAIQTVHLECERARVRHQKLVKNLINFKAGIEHLVHTLDFLPSDVEPTDASVATQLITAEEKLRRMFLRVKNDPGFKAENFKQSSTGVGQYLHAEDLARSRRARKIQLKKAEDAEGGQSSEQDDEDEDDTISRKIKRRDQVLHQQNMSRNGTSAVNNIGSQPRRILKKVARVPF